MEGISFLVEKLVVTSGIFLTRALLGLVRTLPAAGEGGGRSGPPIYLGNQQT